MVGYVIHYKKSSNNYDAGEIMVKKEGGGNVEERRRRRRQQRRQKAALRPRPEWAERLLQGRFFGACAAHGALRRGEENYFCVDCGSRMCFHCLERQGHGGHRLLQIRKYVYRDVVRVDDLQKLLDLSRIQPYTVNSAKVVHLNPRDKSIPSKPNSGGPACRICRQSVCGDLNRYCSVACKLSEEESEEEEPEPSDDNNAAERSEPSIHDPTSDIDDDNGTDKEADSFLASSQDQHHRQHQHQHQHQLYDSGEENQGPRKQRRKGVPRRAPEF